MFKDKILEYLEKIPQSAGNLQIGPLRIHPYLEISGTYDDNVLNAPNNPANDFYNTYEPKISLELPIRDHSIAFDYGYTILEYEGYSSRLPEQDRVSRYGIGSANLNFANGFSIGFSERFNIIRKPGRFTRRANTVVDDPLDEEDTEDDSEILEQFGIDTFTPAREYTNNVALVEVNLPDFFNKLDFIIGVSNIDNSYKTRAFKEGNDRNINRFTGSILIKPLPKIEIKTGIEYQDIRYDKRPDQDSVYRKIPFNIAWKATAKSYFFLNTSYNTRDYGNRSTFKNFSGYDATLGYRFNVTQKDNLIIKIERSLREQQFQTRPISSSSSSTVPDTNPYYFTQLNIDWTHSFNNKFSIIFSPGIQHTRFREKQFYTSKSGTSVLKHEKTDTIRFEVKGRYDAPYHDWLFSEIAYRYQDRNSNLVGSDLIKNEFLISVGLNF